MLESTSNGSKSEPNNNSEYEENIFGWWVWTRLGQKLLDHCYKTEKSVGSETEKTKMGEMQ